MILRMVLIIIKVAPIGVFALIARTFATQGLDIFRPLLGYCIVVVAALLLHLVLTYGSLLRISGLSPLRFLSQVRAPMSFAFSTSSSGATIPVTLNTVETRLGVKNSVASFTVPLGATINMDGTAIMQGVATVFIANVYGIDLALGDFVAVILTATLASIGTAAVPSAGLIMLAMVLTQVGLPVEPSVQGPDGRPGELRHIGDSRPIDTLGLEQLHGGREDLGKGALAAGLLRFSHVIRILIRN